MSIGYENEGGLCIRRPELDAGHWYLDDRRRLFIVPDNGEVEGPDDGVLDDLNESYRASTFADIDQDAIALKLGLVVVHPWQQRFCPSAGYFAA